MTLAIAVGTADGLVLAADSRTTVQQQAPGGPASQRVLSDFTHKVFAIKEIGVAIFGTAFIDTRNIAGHMAEFVASEARAFASPEDVANSLGSFFAARMTPTDGDLGLLVAGYHDGTGMVHEAIVPRGLVAELFTTARGGAAWRGQTDVVQRVVKGVDRDSLKRLAERDGRLQEAEDLESTLDKLEYQIPFGHMNLQDGIDFAVLAIRTTIDVQRLSLGTLGDPGTMWPGVGGPIEIAAISEQGLRWIQRTDLEGERTAGATDA